VSDRDVTNFAFAFDDMRMLTIFSYLIFDEFESISVKCEYCILFNLTELY